MPNYKDGSDFLYFLENENRLFFKNKLELKWLEEIIAYYRNCVIFGFDIVKLTKRISKIKV